MDLYLAASLIALISLGAMIVGTRVGRQASHRTQFIVQLSVLLVGILYTFCAWNRPVLTQLLPHTGLIVLANWHPVIGSFFAGMYFTSSRVMLCRRMLVGTATLGLAGYSIIAPLAGHPPECIPSSASRILVSQSTPHTCSAAVAASLLRLHGIPATEGTMAELCLTREGTHWLGVYRGLKLMTRNSRWDVVVQPFSCAAARRLGRRPAIFAVNIDTEDIGTSVEHGFCDNAGHSVLALGPSNGAGVVVFDPAPTYGIETWNKAMFDCVSSGVMLSLVARSEQNGSVEVASRVTRLTQGYGLMARMNMSQIH
jgi:hypothetical protein